MLTMNTMSYRRMLLARNAANATTTTTTTTSETSNNEVPMMYETFNEALDKYFETLIKVVSKCAPKDLKVVQSWYAAFQEQRVSAPKMPKRRFDAICKAYETQLKDEDEEWFIYHYDQIKHLQDTHFGHWFGDISKEDHDEIVNGFNGLRNVSISLTSVPAPLMRMVEQMTHKYQESVADKPEDEVPGFMSFFLNDPGIRAKLNIAPDEDIAKLLPDAADIHQFAQKLGFKIDLGDVTEVYKQMKRT